MYGGCGRLLQHRQPAGMDAKLSQCRLLCAGIRKPSVSAGFQLGHLEALCHQAYIQICVPGFLITWDGELSQACEDSFWIVSTRQAYTCRCRPACKSDRTCRAASCCPLPLLLVDVRLCLPRPLQPSSLVMPYKESGPLCA